MIGERLRIRGMISTNKSISNQLTSGKLIARNTVYNLVGLVAPLAVAFFTVPVIIDGFGIERFGILSLTWTLIGYFSLFDLGLSRALTQTLSIKLGTNSTEDIPATIWTALFMMLLLGIAGMSLIFFASSWFSTTAFKVSTNLQAETIGAIRILALSIPFVIITAGLRGILASYQQFGAISALRLSMGVFMFLGPVAVLFFSTNLIYVVAILAIGRLVIWAIYSYLVARTVPTILRSIQPKREMAIQLITFGGWMTVSNIVSPIMVYLDRFIVGIMVGAVAVAYYTAPQTMVTKALFIPSAFVTVLFPAFATSYTQENNRLNELFEKGVRYIYIIMFPVSLTIVAFSYTGLNLWLGNDFAANSTHVLQWLSIGVFINAMAMTPYSLIQGIGRPDLTAKLHIVELPLYISFTYILTMRFGVTGAAVAWTLRMLFDMGALILLTRVILPRTKKYLRQISSIISVSILLLLLMLVPMHPMIRILAFLMSMMSMFMYVWSIWSTEAERHYTKNLARKMISLRRNESRL